MRSFTCSLSIFYSNKIKFEHTIHGYNNVFADIKKLEGGEPDLANTLGMKFFSPFNYLHGL